MSLFNCFSFNANIIYYRTTQFYYEFSYNGLQADVGGLLKTQLSLPTNVC